MSTDQMPHLAYFHCTLIHCVQKYYSSAALCTAYLTFIVCKALHFLNDTFLTYFALSNQRAHCNGFELVIYYVEGIIDGIKRIRIKNVLLSYFKFKSFFSL